MTQRNQLIVIKKVHLFWVNYTVLEVTINITQVWILRARTTTSLMQYCHEHHGRNQPLKDWIEGPVHKISPSLVLYQNPEYLTREYLDPGEEHNTLILLNICTSKFLPIHLSSYQEISVSPNPHKRSFFLYIMVINTQGHNCFRCWESESLEIPA